MKHIISLLILLLISLSACATTITPAQTHFTPTHILDEAQITQTLNSLTTKQNESLTYIIQHPDSRFIIPLLDVYDLNPLKINEALQVLTNQSITTLPEWKNFCERNNIETNTDYSSWKITQLKFASPFIPNIETIHEHSSLQHIYIKKLLADVPTSLNSPSTTKTGKRISITIQNVTKHYDYAALEEHTVINDKIRDTFILITYCEICFTPVVYNTTQIGGSHFSFEPTNLAHQDNTLIVDNQTNTLWNSVTGYPIMGFLADKGLELELLGFSVVE